MRLLHPVISCGRVASKMMAPGPQQHPVLGPTKITSSRTLNSVLIHIGFQQIGTLLSQVFQEDSDSDFSVGDADHLSCRDQRGLVAGGSETAEDLPRTAKQGIYICGPRTEIKENISVFGDAEISRLQYKIHMFIYIYIYIGTFASTSDLYVYLYIRILYI